MTPRPRLGRVHPGVQPTAPEGLPAGIVHLGLGNFHRAHQAVFTADALRHEAGPWGIRAFANRSASVVDAMTEQDGLYAVVEVGDAGPRCSVPGVHTAAGVAAASPGAVVDAIAAAETRIATLTVTENGYAWSTARGGLDFDDPAVARDLDDPSAPRTAVGQVAAGLHERFLREGGPVSVVSCDNMAGNGRALRRLVVEFASAVPAWAASDFPAWLDSVAFPSTMVDRIVPATTDEHRALVAEQLGVTDACPVPAEPFSMWVLEDDFVAGRPAWDRAGAILTDEVEAYELVKLRLLNGTHSLLASLGVLAGHRTIPDAVGDSAIGRAARAVIAEEYLPSVTMPAGLDAEDYVESLFRRFSNRGLGHQTAQVASDGSRKLPQRVVGPSLRMLEAGAVPHLQCLSVAAFLQCQDPAVRASSTLADAVADPSACKLARLAEAAGGPVAYVTAALDAGLLPEPLASSEVFRERVADLLGALATGGVRAAVGEALGDA